MKVTYDIAADSAYIYLEGKEKQSSLTIPSFPSADGPMVNIDLDEYNKIIGFEILDAKTFLPKSVLDNAENI
jgi:uncharacterized protein YuzE